MQRHCRPRATIFLPLSDLTPLHSMNDHWAWGICQILCYLLENWRIKCHPYPSREPKGKRVHLRAHYLIEENKHLSKHNTILAICIKCSTKNGTFEVDLKSKQEFAKQRRKVCQVERRAGKCRVFGKHEQFWGASYRT